MRVPSVYCAAVTELCATCSVILDLACVSPAGVGRYMLYLETMFRTCTRLSRERSVAAKYVLRIACTLLGLDHVYAGGVLGEDLCVE